MLKDKDHIKDFFQDKLANHKLPVNPQLWSKVSSNLGGSTFGVLGSIVLKTSIVILGITGLSVGIYQLFRLNNQDNIITSKNKEITHVVEQDFEFNSENILPNQDSIVDITNSKLSSEKADFFKRKEDPLKIENGMIDTQESSAISTMEKSTSSGIEINIAPIQVEDQSTPEEFEKVRKPMPMEILIYEQSNQHFQFEISNANNTAVTWDFSDGTTASGTFVEHLFNQSGAYEVIAMIDSGENTVVLKTTIQIEIKGKITLLPNVFSPNNDGSNDFFFIESEGLKEFSIVVMSQSGKVVFESDSPEFKWNGIERSTGVIAPKDNYFYLITAKDEFGNSISAHQKLQVLY